MNPQHEKGMQEWARNEDPRRHCYTSYTDRSIEKRQLEEAIEVTEDNVDYLYGEEFTPTTVDYPQGTRPLLEMIVEKVCADCRTPREKAIALVNWRRLNITHIGKCGLGSEEEIILGGYSMCHDAARTMIILAQVAGLGARMVLGLNDEQERGHTLSEVHVGDGWAIMDPSPMLPWGYLETPEGRLLNAWDIRTNPELVGQCPTTPGDWERVGQGLRNAAMYADLFPNYRLTNYSLEDSTRFMALRFLRYVTAHKALDNYDYTGHLSSDPLSKFLDLDQTVEEWVEASLENVRENILA